MNELTNLREQIDALDAQITRLLCERLNTVKIVSEYKKSHGFEILQESREAEVLEKIAENINNPEYQEYILEIYAAILKTSKDFQEKT